EFNLDIDDSDLHLTPVLHPSSSTRVEPSSSTPNPVRIIPGHAGIIQQAKLLKEKVFILDSDGALMSTQEYIQKVVDDVSGDDDFKSGSWVSATNYVNANGGTVTGCLGDIKNFLKNEKPGQVVAIVKSSSPNVLGDLTVTVKDPQVMAILVILVSSDSFEDSVGTPAGQVILFGTIPTTILDTTPVITPPTTQTDTTVIPIETPIIAPNIPPSLDYTLTSPDYSPASETESDPSRDPSSDHIPSLPTLLPFLSSDDDTMDSDIPDTPPLPTHGTPFPVITSSTQRSPVIPRRRVMILAPGQSRDSSSDSSLEASSDFHSDTSSDSSLRHSLSDHSSPNLPSTSAGPSRKRRRSPMTSVHALPLVSGALSLVYADLIPSPKRVRDSGYLADVEVIEGIQREQGHRIFGVESAVIALTERVAKLERDNRRLRGTTSIESQRVDRLQRGMSRMQREMRQMRRLQFYDQKSHRVLRCRKMPNTRSGASMTHEEVEELVARRVAEEMKAHEAARNLETLFENGDEREIENEGNENEGNGRNGNGDNGGNGGNGNGGNGENRNHGMNYGGFMP
nr:hypothetical protein [Tanacetum cinerariifolium]